MPRYEQRYTPLLSWHTCVEACLANDASVAAYAVGERAARYVSLACYVTQRKGSTIHQLCASAATALEGTPVVIGSSKVIDAARCLCAEWLS
jgi:hypothetical protein